MRSSLLARDMMSELEYWAGAGEVFLEYERPTVLPLPITDNLCIINLTHIIMRERGRYTPVKAVSEFLTASFLRPDEIFS